MNKFLSDAKASGFDLEWENDGSGASVYATKANRNITKGLAKFAELQAQQWISVEDRLPDKKCLAYYANELGNARTVCAKYTKKYSEEAGTDDEWIDYCEADDTYYYPEGWYEMIDNWDDYTFVTINHQVTHWMPLPSPPINAENIS